MTNVNDAPDLLKMLACLQGELESKDEIITRLRNLSLTCEKDDLSSLKSFYNVQIGNLEKIIHSQHNAYSTVKQQYFELEQKYRKHTTSSSPIDIQDKYEALVKEKEDIMAELLEEKTRTTQYEDKLRRVLTCWKTAHAVLINQRRVTGALVLQHRSLVSKLNDTLGNKVDKKIQTNDIVYSQGSLNTSCTVFSSTGQVNQNRRLTLGCEAKIYPPIVNQINGLITLDGPLSKQNVQTNSSPDNTDASVETVSKSLSNLSINDDNSSSSRSSTPSPPPLPPPALQLHYPYPGMQGYVGGHSKTTSSRPTSDSPLLSSQQVRRCVPSRPPQPNTFGSPSSVNHTHQPYHHSPFSWMTSSIPQNRYPATTTNPLPVHVAPPPCCQTGTRGLPTISTTNHYTHHPNRASTTSPPFLRQQNLNSPCPTGAVVRHLQSASYSQPIIRPFHSPRDASTLKSTESSHVSINGK